MKLRWWGRTTERVQEWASEIDERFPQCSRLVREALVKHRRRYERSATRYLRWFRSMGVVEIVLSLSLPIIALTNLLYGQIAIAVVSITIAAIAALRSFFRLHENWQLFRSQELMLEILVREWEFELLKAIADRAEDLPARAFALTGNFLDRLHESLRGEYETYVESVQTPKIPRLGTAAQSGE